MEASLDEVARRVPLVKCVTRGGSCDWTGLCLCTEPTTDAAACILHDLRRSSQRSANQRGRMTLCDL
jgi:hypothetical protein